MLDGQRIERTSGRRCILSTITVAAAMVAAARRWPADENCSRALRFVLRHNRRGRQAAYVLRPVRLPRQRPGAAADLSCGGAAPCAAPLKEEHHDELPEKTPAQSWA